MTLNSETWLHDIKTCLYEYYYEQYAEIKDDDNSNPNNEEESIDSNDPDFCLKIFGQQARAQSQQELDSIPTPEQCLASKNKETATMAN